MVDVDIEGKWLWNLTGYEGIPTFLDFERLYQSCFFEQPQHTWRHLVSFVSSRMRQTDRTYTIQITIERWASKIFMSRVWRRSKT